MDTAQRILLKADEMFRRYGIRAVTLDEIANTLGISKKTIYQYFTDKDALVDAVMDGEFKQTLKDCRHCSVEAKDAVQEIILLMENMEKDFRNLNPLVLFDLKKFHYNTFLKFDEFMHQHLLQMVKDNLVRGVEEGLYRESINIDILSRFRMASVQMLFDLQVFPPGKFDLATVSTAILDHFLYGVVNAKGYKLIEKYKISNK